MFLSSRGAASAALFAVFITGMAASSARAQSPTGSFEVGPSVSVLRLNELDTTDVGGGAIVPVDATGRWKVRVDVGDLIVRYGEEATRPNNARTDGFLSHNLLFSAGLVFRF